MKGFLSKACVSGAGLGVDPDHTELIACLYDIFSLLRQVLSYYAAYFLKKEYIMVSIAYSKNLKTCKTYKEK